MMAQYGRLCCTARFQGFPFLSPLNLPCQIVSASWAHNKATLAARMLQIRLSKTANAVLEENHHGSSANHIHMAVGQKWVPKIEPW